MCGRYLFTSEQCAEAREIAQMICKKYGEGSWQPGEIAPGAKAPVLAVSHGAITPELFTWGYRLPHTLVINARAENVMEKPLFRASAASRRCVVPSVGFFEWDALKWTDLLLHYYHSGQYVHAGSPCTDAIDIIRESNAGLAGTGRYCRRHSPYRTASIGKAVAGGADKPLVKRRSTRFYQSIGTSST